MSSTGAGYDYSCGQFSPDGRVFQVEYAQKAVENSGTAVGLKCSDGIVLAVEKPQQSKMLVPGSNRRVFGVDKHASIAITGFVADGRQIVNRAREEAKNYEDIYGHKIVPSILSSRLGGYVHYFTKHGSLRPFGASTLLAAYDEDTKTPELYMVEPSGLVFRYFGCAAGKGANAAKTEIEKIFTKRAEEGITCADAIDEIAKLMYTIRDASKDKPFELEMGWLCAATDYKHALVPTDVVKDAEERAKALVESGGDTPAPDASSTMET
jgi:20S proteasome subunit alpha 7